MRIGRGRRRDPAPGPAVQGWEAGLCESVPTRLQPLRKLFVTQEREGVLWCGRPATAL